LWFDIGTHLLLGTLKFTPASAAVSNWQVAAMIANWGVDAVMALGGAAAARLDRNCLMKHQQQKA
jgi:hypothetical protein